MNRQHRLTHRRQFADVRRLRISARCGCLRVQAGPNGGMPLRAGFAITGLRRAVDRNLVRRRLRVLLQARVLDLGGLDILVAAGAVAAAVPFAQLRSELDDCLARVAGRARASGRSPHRSGSPLPDNGVKTRRPASGGIGAAIVK